MRLPQHLDTVCISTITRVLVGIKIVMRRSPLKKAFCRPGADILILCIPNTKAKLTVLTFHAFATARGREVLSVVAAHLHDALAMQKMATPNPMGVLSCTTGEA